MCPILTSIGVRSCIPFHFVQKFPYVHKPRPSSFNPSTRLKRVTTTRLLSAFSMVSVNLDSSGGRRGFGWPLCEGDKQCGHRATSLQGERGEKRRKRQRRLGRNLPSSCGSVLLPRPPFCILCPGAGNKTWAGMAKMDDHLRQVSLGSLSLTIDAGVPHRSRSEGLCLSFVLYSCYQSAIHLLCSLMDSRYVYTLSW